MITSSDSPFTEERDAQSICSVFTAHHGDFRAVPLANRTSLAARSSIPDATSSTDESPADELLPSSPSWPLSASAGGNAGYAAENPCIPLPGLLPQTKTAKANSLV